MAEFADQYLNGILVRKNIDAATACECNKDGYVYKCNGKDINGNICGAILTPCSRFSNGKHTFYFVCSNGSHIKNCPNKEESKYKTKVVIEKCINYDPSAINMSSILAKITNSSSKSTGGKSTSPSIVNDNDKKEKNNSLLKEYKDVFNSPSKPEEIYLTLNHNKDEIVSGNKNLYGKDYLLNSINQKDHKKGNMSLEDKVCIVVVSTAGSKGMPKDIKQKVNGFNPIILSEPYRYSENSGYKYNKIYFRLIFDNETTYKEVSKKIFKYFDYDTKKFTKYVCWVVLAYFDKPVEVAGKNLIYDCVINSSKQIQELKKDFCNIYDSELLKIYDNKN